MAIRKMSKKQREQQPYDDWCIESRVWRYQTGDDTSYQTKQIILDTCKPVFINRGWAWDVHAQDLVMLAVDRYNPFFGQPFIPYLINALEAQAGQRVPYTKEDVLQADSYDGTGFTTFDREWTSVEERINISVKPTIREGALSDAETE